MMKLWNATRALKIWNDSHGQDMVEYALAAGFIVGVAVALSPALGTSIGSIFGRIVAELQATGGGTAAPTV
jgi:pilus assembly protein Flp/PilA